MLEKQLHRLVLAGAAVGMLLASIPASAQPTQAPPQGVEVLARGPVHEGYAEQVNPVPKPFPLVSKQPPTPIPEVPAEQKPEGNVQWIPGYWGWDDERTDYI